MQGLHAFSIRRDPCVPLCAAQTHAVCGAMVAMEPVVLGVCALLIVQNTAHTLLLSYSRLRPGQPYLGSVIVVLSEAVKIVANLLCNIGVNGWDATRKELRRVYHEEASRIWHYGVPAVLYTVQNNLSFVAAANLSIVQYQVFNQLRIPATAVTSRLLLGQQISAMRWTAVMLLTVGVALVAYKPDTPGKQFRSAVRQPMLGFAATLGCCFCSALAGVWFEKIVKVGSNPPTLWIASHLLAVCALPIALATAWTQDGDKLREGGPWQGFDGFAAGVLAMLALGGIAAGLTIRYASTVIKTFCTSIAMVLITVASWLIFGASLSPLFMLGVALVLAATVLFALQPDLKQIGELLGFAQGDNAMYDVEQRKRVVGLRRIGALLVVTVLVIVVRSQGAEAAPTTPVSSVISNSTTHARRHAVPHNAPKRSHSPLNRTTATGMPSRRVSFMSHTHQKPKA